MALLFAWISGVVIAFSLMSFLTGWHVYGLIGLVTSVLCLVAAYRGYRDELGIQAYEDGED